MNTVIYKVLSFFSSDAGVNFLLNKIAHISLDWGAANAKIAKAEEKFKRVRAKAVSDFESRKKATLERTKNAVALLEQEVKLEEAELETYYDEALTKISDKKSSVKEIVATLKHIGSKDFSAN